LQRRETIFKGRKKNPLRGQIEGTDAEATKEGEKRARNSARGTPGPYPHREDAEGEREEEEGSREKERFDARRSSRAGSRKKRNARVWPKEEDSQAWGGGKERVIVKKKKNPERNND